jgi:hypothetical protein
MKWFRLGGLSAIALVGILSFAAFRVAPEATAASAPQVLTISSADLSKPEVSLSTHATQGRPAQCQSVPVPIRDIRTGQFVESFADRTYRGWMAAFTCHATGVSQRAVFAVVWLVAREQCQIVVLGKPYTTTYTDAGGKQETITTTTGLTMLQDDRIVYRSPAGTVQLCPGQVLHLRFPLLDGTKPTIALFSLALPTGGFHHDIEF